MAVVEGPHQAQAMSRPRWRLTTARLRGIGMRHWRGSGIWVLPTRGRRRGVIVTT
jgi:hypothetical protein